MGGFPAGTLSIEIGYLFALGYEFWAWRRVLVLGLPLWVLSVGVAGAAIVPAIAGCARWALRDEPG